MKHWNTICRAGIALASTLLASAAAAQSSVTLFGVVDAAVRSTDTKDVGRITSLISGGYSSSRFGFRGQEDLGSGLSAGFWLESFLNTDNGTATPDGFKRRSTLSLISRDYGELRMGRDFTPTHSTWSRFDPFNYVGLGSVQLFALSATGRTPVTAAFGTNPNTIQRASNGVQYLLPRNAWGVEGAVVSTFGEGGQPANDQYRANGGRLGISRGPMAVLASAFATHGSGLAGAFKDAAFAAVYEWDVVKLSFAIRRYEYLQATQGNYMLGAVVNFGVQELKLSYNRASMGGRVGATDISRDRADQLALGHVYHLSKRTRTYATVATIRNEGNSRFVLPGAVAGPAGASSRGIEVGMNHEF